MDKNVLALAYLGDAVYELAIREYLLNLGIVKVNELQKQAITYVSAKGQATYLTKLLEEQFLTEEEQEVVYRARNHKGTRHPKNTDILTYKHATGFEALIGYLYLERRKDRIEEIMNKIRGE